MNSADACDIAGSEFAYWPHTQLRAVLEMAAARAAQSSRATPVSLVWPLPVGDPLRIFQALQGLSPADCFFWEQPSQQLALVGAGTALRLQTHGDGRFTDAALAWQQVRDEAVIAYAPGLAPDSTGAGHGPVLFGGFRFDPLRPRTALWQDFPDGLLVLPRLLFSQHEEQATVTLSCLVDASAHLDNLVDHMREEIARLAALFALSLIHI